MLRQFVEANKAAGKSAEAAADLWSKLEQSRKSGQERHRRAREEHLRRHPRPEPDPPREDQSTDGSGRDVTEFYGGEHFVKRLRPDRPHDPERAESAAAPDTAPLPDDAPPRPRGPRPEVSNRVKDEMLALVREKGRECLDNKTEKEMMTNFKASRHVCRDARTAVLLSQNLSKK